MMKTQFCPGVREDIQAVLDQAADARQQERAMAHCRQCSECARALHELAAVRRLVRAMPRYSPAAGFDGALRDRLGAEADRLSHSTGLRAIAWRVGPVFAACCLVGGLYLAFRANSPVAPAGVRAPSVSIVREGPGPQTPEDIYTDYASEDPLADPARVDVEFGTAMAKAFPELK